MTAATSTPWSAGCSPVDLTSSGRALPDGFGRCECRALIPDTGGTCNACGREWEGTRRDAAGAQSGARLLETHLRRELSGFSPADVIPIGIARDRWRTFRRTHYGPDGIAYGTAAPDLLTAPDSQPKTGKNATPTWVLHLLPVDQAGGANVCPWATSCAAVCLVSSGRGAMSNVKRGRMARTRFLEADPAAFVSVLWANIAAKHATTRRKGIADTIGIRLNGTSDLRWERIVPALFDTFAGVVFYDYTKAPAGARRDLPANYHLTASATERDALADIVAKAHAFGRVAIVVDTPAPKGNAPKRPLPSTWAGLPAVDGDETDWRLEDGPVAILLRAKGDAVGDTSGFVRSTHQDAP